LTDGDCPRFKSNEFHVIRREDVRIILPPAALGSLLGKAKQLLPQWIAHAVVVKQLRDLFGGDAVPA